ncbi:MAG: hypothetical protein C4289_09280 [Chloroflexota bacterium]
MIGDMDAALGLRQRHCSEHRSLCQTAQVLRDGGMVTQPHDTQVVRLPLGHPQPGHRCCWQKQLRWHRQIEGVSSINDPAAGDDLQSCSMPIDGEVCLRKTPA